MAHMYEEEKRELVALLTSRPRAAPKAFIEKYVNGLLDTLQVVHGDPDSIAAELARIRSFLSEDTPFGYVNLACELALASWFKIRHPEGFAYQVPTPLAETTTGIQRTFDFRFHTESAQYNVEVKNFSRAGASTEGKDPLKLFLPPAQANALVGAGLNPEGTSRKALRQFLTKANGQLVRPDGGLSVVVICCNDVDEYADAMECLVGEHGLVKDVSELDKIPNIDGIVFCLLGFMHHSALDAAITKKVYQDESVTLHDGFDAWQYDPALPVGVFPVQTVEVRTQTAGDDFGQTFRLQNVRFNAHRERHPKDLQGAIFALFNDSIRVA